MKKKFLSLTLGSLLVSTLSAEDNGFFVSAGYQIGESAQMVKNTKGIQDLSDSYERLNNLLTNYSTLNTLIRQSSDPNAINNARTNLDASAKNLINDKTNSPAYQMGAFKPLKTHQQINGEGLPLPVALLIMNQDHIALYPLKITQKSIKLIKSSKRLLEQAGRIFLP